MQYPLLSLEQNEIVFHGLLLENAEKKKCFLFQVFHITRSQTCFFFFLKKGYITLFLYFSHNFKHTGIKCLYSHFSLYGERRVNIHLFYLLLILIILCHQTTDSSPVCSTYIINV